MAVAVGFSLWSCSDEAPGPGVGPDVSWQIFCGEDPDNMCSTSEAPHGPLDGLDEDDKLDDYKLKASCKKLGSGLTIRIEDPGREANIPKKLRARARSILEISRIKGENQCFVTVSEYPTSTNAELRIQDTCMGTESTSGQPGSCTLEGEEDTSNGYAYEGTLICEGMRYRGQGAGVYALRQAGNDDEPVKLQIANCD
jgi:hypothetical protein